MLYAPLAYVVIFLAMTKPTLKELLEAGVHFGHRVNKWNPKMSTYIYGQKEGIHILDLEKTLGKLMEAAEFVRELASKGGRIIFISTKRQVQETVKNEAQRSGSMFMTSRWIGGLLTNFEAVRKTVDKLPELEEKRKTMEEQGYTKREQLLVDREIEKLEKSVGGIRGLDKLPTAVFIVDSHKENNAVLEAKKTGVVVVAITDTNGDPTLIDYPIPANDDAIKSISLIVKVIADAIEEGRALYQKKVSDEEKKAQEAQLETVEEVKEEVKKPAVKKEKVVVKEKAVVANKKAPKKEKTLAKEKKAQK